MDTVVAFGKTEWSCGQCKELLTKTSIWTERLHVSPGTLASQPFPFPAGCEACHRDPWLCHTPSQFWIQRMQVLWGHPLIYKYQLKLLVRSNDRVVAERVMGHATIDPLWAFKCILIAWASVVCMLVLLKHCLVSHLYIILTLNSLRNKQTNKTHTLVNTHTRARTN